MDTHKKLREHISALSDGELPDSDLELALAALRDPDGHETWNIYHWIGDMLRAERPPDLTPAFAKTLAAKLGLESAPPVSRYLDLIASLSSGMAARIDQAANDLMEVLRSFSQHVPDKDMIRLTVRARDVLALAKGRGQLVGVHYGDAMKLCAKHWKRLYPTMASTGLAGQEQAAVAAMQSATTPVALRAASEDAGTVAWLYEVSALLGEDVSERLAHNPVPIRGTHYYACHIGNVLQYLQCGASYNVNQFVRVDLSDPAAPPLIIVGEAKGGSGGYGMVQGPRTFMVQQGISGGVISQRDKLYPLSRAVYMTGANTAVPAGKARRLAGKAIEQADLDGMLLYVAVRGRIDMAKQVVSSEIEVFAC